MGGSREREERKQRGGISGTGGERKTATNKTRCFMMMLTLNIPHHHHLLLLPHPSKKSIGNRK